MTKKGQAEMLEWFPRLILLIVAVVAVIALVRVFTERDVDAPILGRGAYLYRLYYGDVIMYKDPVTRRVYPGIVDVEKLDEQRLDGIFVERAKGDALAKISSLITITPQAGCTISAKSVYNNRDTYLLKDPFNMGMAGGATRETVIFPVTLRQKNAECPGILNITIVRPNS